MLPLLSMRTGVKDDACTVFYGKERGITLQYSKHLTSRSFPVCETFVPTTTLGQQGETWGLRPNHGKQ